MTDKKETESYRAGTPRHIILDYLKETESEWECIEIPPNKKSKTRIIKFIKKEITNE
jgi:hypothetical protein